MNRTLEDYDSMAKREMIKAKQEKAMMYVPFPEAPTGTEIRTVANRLFWWFIQACAEIPD
jgi:hypothetical protein